MPACPKLYKVLWELVCSSVKLSWEMLSSQRQDFGPSHVSEIKRVECKAIQRHPHPIILSKPSRYDSFKGDLKVWKPRTSSTSTSGWAICTDVRCTVKQQIRQELVGRWCLISIRDGRKTCCRNILPGLLQCYTLRRNWQKEHKICTLRRLVMGKEQKTVLDNDTLFRFP